MTRINQNSNYWIGNQTGSFDAWWREDEEAEKPVSLTEWKLIERK